MRIGIDISQIVHEGTGVATYLREMVRAMLTVDKKNEYVLFGASLRKRYVFTQYFRAVEHLTNRVHLIIVPIPPTLLDFLWNRLHVLPIERFIGRVDVFWSSDWTQPPLAHARGITTIHDLSIFRYPEASHASTQYDWGSGRLIANIVETQKQRLAWVKHECKIILCDSEATKQDVMSLVGIAGHKLKVIYPGI